MMTVLCILGVWVAASFIFVLSLGFAARKPMPRPESDACLLEEAA
jgi:hypothetical protein